MKVADVLRPGRPVGWTRSSPASTGDQGGVAGRRWGRTYMGLRPVRPGRNLIAEASVRARPRWAPTISIRSESHDLATPTARRQLPSDRVQGRSTSRAEPGPDHPDTLASRSNLAVGLRVYRPHHRSHRAARGDAQATGGEAGPRPPRNAHQSQQSAPRPTAPLAGRSEADRHGRGDAQAARVPSSGPDTPTRSIAATTWPSPTWPPAGVRGDRACSRRRSGCRKRKLGPDHPHTLMSRNDGRSARSLTAVCRPGTLGGDLPLVRGERLPSCRRAEAQAPTHPRNCSTADTCSGRCRLRVDSADGLEAEGLYRDVMARRRKAVKPDSPLLAEDLARVSAGTSSSSRGGRRPSRCVREAVAIRVRATPDDWKRYDAMQPAGRGRCWVKGGYAEAEPPVVAGYEGLKARGEASRCRPGPACSRAAMLRGAAVRGLEQAESARLWKIKLGLPDLPADVFARP